MNSNFRKINLYVLSLGLLFLFIVIITFEPTIAFSELAKLQGWSRLVKANYVSMIAIGGIAYCGFAYVLFCHQLKGATELPFEITKVESVEYEHLTFLATYVVPLISFDFGSGRQLVVLGLLLIAMGAIYVKTDLFYANPSLALLGFRIYRIDGNFKMGDRTGLIVICRGKLTVGQKASYIKLDEKIYFAKGKKK
ncbi:anti-phage protein KwaA [Rhodopirellula europaea]|uniref:Putative membrane protein n=1 Tax=Rhodopirellula europaea SH398 TaxID=1263868 RepID=M5S364_9BACT|nr:anti-phage protein KwaA [Rhodopirellula europaea]EMI25970.1 putative membrane protein [Rhodopirellula europaea SH398]